MSHLDELEKHLRRFPRRDNASPEGRASSVPHRVAGARPNATLRGPRALPSNGEDDDALNQSMQSMDIHDRVNKLREAVGTVPSRKKAPPPMPAKSATVGRQTSRPADPFEYALNGPYSDHAIPPTVDEDVSPPPPIPHKPFFDSKTQVTPPSAKPASTYPSASPTVPLVVASTAVSAPVPAISVPIPTIAAPSLPSDESSRKSPPPQSDRVRVPNPLYTGVRCAGCDKPLSGMTITVASRPWHNECFKCNHCGQLLEHVEFDMKDGIPYCALDYEELFSERCAYCDTPIVEKSIVALGKHYHVGHFFCRECGTPFDESSAFIEGDDHHPYCEKDYMAKFGAKCMGCKENITREYLSALDEKWHKQCFVCAVSGQGHVSIVGRLIRLCKDCGKEFKERKFRVRNNKPYCIEKCQSQEKAWHR